MKHKIVIYTDGSAKPNPGVGGWGAVMLCPELEHRVDLYGAYEHTTNNRMELMAIIKGLEAVNLGRCESVVLYSDSNYSINPYIQGWITGYRKNDWKNKSMPNYDLLVKLDELYLKFDKIEFKKVKAHSGDIYNDIADHLAENASEKIKDHPMT